MRLGACRSLAVPRGSTVCPRLFSSVAPLQQVKAVGNDPNTLLREAPRPRMGFHFFLSNV